MAISDLSTGEIATLLDLSQKLKSEKHDGQERPRLIGKNIVLLFEKLSTRTRCAFEIAAHDQGAHVTYIGNTDSHLGEKESVRDTARVLGRIYDGIGYRGYEQAVVEELAEFAGVPVWNGLTNEAHPTQVIADFMTMREHCERPLNEMKFSYLGDSRNNTAYSLLMGAAKMGMELRFGAPRTYWPRGACLSKAQDIAQDTGAKIVLTEDPREAVDSVDFVYTDVWLSLGEAQSRWAERIKALYPFQVNYALMQATCNPYAKFMHCLPAFHNPQAQIGGKIMKEYGIEAMEVTDDVFESTQSVVFDQAENRLHSIKAILIHTLTS